MVDIRLLRFQRQVENDWRSTQHLLIVPTNISLSQFRAEIFQ
jgi:hypothetical protein